MHKYLLLSLSLITCTYMFGRTSEHIEHELLHKILQKHAAQAYAESNEQHSDPFEQQILNTHQSSRESLQPTIKMFIEAKLSNADESTIALYRLKVENEMLPLKKDLIAQHDAFNFFKNIGTGLCLVFACNFVSSKKYNLKALNNKEDLSFIAACGLGALVLQLTKNNTKPLVTSYENSLYTIEALKLQLARAEKKK